MYLDELFYLVENINKRQTRDWKMQLAIAQNPYTKKPQDLWKLIDKLEEKEEEYQGVAALKQLFSKNKRFNIK